MDGILNTERRNKFLIGIVLAGVVIALFIFAALRLFPVAVVNGSSISYGEYNEYQSAFERFKSVASTNGTSSAAILGFDNVDQNELKRSLLESLVIREILKVGIEREFGKDVEDAVDSELDKVLASRDSATLVAVAERIYGMSFEDFRETILIPEARKSVAVRLLNEKGKNFEEWFSEQRVSADVDIRLLPYVWENAELKNE